MNIAKKSAAFLALTAVLSTAGIAAAVDINQLMQGPEKKCDEENAHKCHPKPFKMVVEKKCDDEQSHKCHPKP